MEKQQPPLEAVRNWAKEKIASGSEPPWAWYQYMKLIETLDAILGGQACVTTKESSPQSESRPGVHLQLVGPKYSQDIAQSHPDRAETIPLPM